MNGNDGRARLLAAALLAGVAATAAAADRTVEVEGVAAILAGDVPQARDSAVADALRRAVEQVAGVLVDSRVVVLDELLADSHLRTRAQGFVRLHEVLEAGTTRAGTFQVRVRAVVSDVLVEDEIARLAYRDRVLVLVEESGPGAFGVSVVESQLLSALRGAGYRNLVEARAVLGPKERALLERARRGEGGEPARAARSAGLRYAAGAVVVGELRSVEPVESAPDYWTARAEGRLRAFETRTARLLCEVAVGPETRGFGTTAQRAGLDALRRAGSTAGATLLRTLTPRGERTLRVTAYDVPDFDAFERLRNFLVECRFVQAVEPDSIGFHRRKSVLRVVYDEEPALLARNVSAWPEVEVVSASDEGIEVRFRAAAKEEP